MMNAHQSAYRKIIFFALIILLSTIPTAFCKDAPSQPVTTGNQKISIENLGLLLKPLTKEELSIEADGWRDLLKEKVKKISDVQIRSNAAEGTEKEALLEKVAKLQEERTGLIDRLEAVLEEMTAKGGGIKDYEQYIQAVSGIEVERDDTYATWVAIQNWLTSKEGGIRWGLNIIKFLLILLVIKIIGGIARKITKKALINSNLSELLKEFLANLVHKIVFILGLMVALSMLEINVGPLVAGLGVVGFVVGFALQNTLSNFAAGFMLLIYRPYDIGDFVTAGGASGEVASMNLVTTTVKTPDNQNVIIPNAEIWGGVITNVTGNDTRRVDLIFGIGYDDNISKVQSILEEIVNDHNLTLKTPEPVIKVHQLADSSVNFVCRPWAKTSDYWDVYWDITRKVKERFDAEGISIPYPQQDVHMHQAG